MSSNKATNPKQSRTKKAKDAPRRPLSAYNLYFKYQRALLLVDSEDDDQPTQQAPIVIGGSYSAMLATTDHTVVQPFEGSRARQGRREHRRTHGKVGFAELARQIGQKWRSLDEAERQPFVEQARVEKERYQEEVRRYRERKAMNVDDTEETKSNEHSPTGHRAAASQEDESHEDDLSQKGSDAMDALDDIEPICIFPPVPSHSSNTAA